MSNATPVPTIKAIETRYAGCRFRSRLEARWAVFFDTLGMRWEYEPQGLLVDGEPYLPDFWLPDLRLWVEVKGSFEKSGSVSRFLRVAAYLSRGGGEGCGYDPCGDNGLCADFGKPDGTCMGACCVVPRVHEGNDVLLLGPLTNSTEPGIPAILHYCDGDLQAICLACFLVWRGRSKCPAVDSYVCRELADQPHSVLLFLSDGVECANHQNGPSGDLEKAISVARRARFEHGETPAARR